MLSNAKNVRIMSTVISRFMGENAYGKYKVYYIYGRIKQKG